MWVLWTLLSIEGSIAASEPVILRGNAGLYNFMPKHTSAFGIRTSLENVSSYVHNDCLVKVVPLYAISDLKSSRWIISEWFWCYLPDRQQSENWCIYGMLSLHHLVSWDDSALCEYHPLKWWYAEYPHAVSPLSLPNVLHWLVTAPRHHWYSASYLQMTPETLSRVRTAALIDWLILVHPSLSICKETGRFFRSVSLLGFIECSSLSYAKNFFLFSIFTYTTYTVMVTYYEPVVYVV